jgi:hypothetical protein
MGFLKATYRAFQVSAGEEKKANAELIKVHMNMCVKHYHALIPQIDLIATQWGVTLEDTLSQDDLGSLRTEGSRQRRQTELDGQLRQQLEDIRREKVRTPIQVPSTTAGLRELYSGGKRSIDGQSEEVVRVLIQNKEEIGKRRTTKGLLSKAEEDLRLLRNQVSGASASKGVADQHSEPHGKGIGRSGSSGLNAGLGGPSASSHHSSHSHIHNRQRQDRIRRKQRTPRMWAVKCCAFLEKRRRHRREVLLGVTQT